MQGNALNYSERNASACNSAPNAEANAFYAPFTSTKETSRAPWEVEGDKRDLIENIENHNNNIYSYVTTYIIIFNR